MTAHEVTSERSLILGLSSVLQGKYSQRSLVEVMLKN
jgi:hypothetical protein